MKLSKLCPRIPGGVGHRGDKNWACNSMQLAAAHLEKGEERAGFLQPWQQTLTDLVASNGTTVPVRSLGVRALKSRCWCSVTPPEGTRSKSVPSLIVWKRPPAFLTVWPPPHLQSMSCQPLALASHLTSRVFTLLRPSNKDMWDYSGPVQAIQNRLPVPRSLTWSHICKVPFAVKGV